MKFKSIATLKNHCSVYHTYSRWKQGALKILSLKNCNKFTSQNKIIYMTYVEFYNVIHTYLLGYNLSLSDGRE